MGGQILRNVQGRIRQFLAKGMEAILWKESGVRMTMRERPRGSDRKNPARIRTHGIGGTCSVAMKYPGGSIDLVDELQFSNRRFERHLEFVSIPAGHNADLLAKSTAKVKVSSRAGVAVTSSDPGELLVSVIPNREQKATVVMAFELPPAAKPRAGISCAARSQGRPRRLARTARLQGHRLSAAEDRLRRGPRHARRGRRAAEGRAGVRRVDEDRRAVRAPRSDRRRQERPTFENYGHGLYQDALSMLAEDDGLYVLHRRNLTKIIENETGTPTASTASPRCRTASPTPTTWPTAWPATRPGRFVFGYAPYAEHDDARRRRRARA